MACPSCDSKRAIVESGHTLEELLADVPYRQWVLVLPKRLRYFVHRDKRLLLYVLRPALSLKQLTYKPEQDLVRYRPAKGRPDSPAVLEWSGA